MWAPAGTRPGEPGNLFATQAGGEESSFARTRQLSGSSHFLANAQLFSLAPGFSRVKKGSESMETVSTVSFTKWGKAVKTAFRSDALNTGLKPGANERLQKTEMRAIPSPGFYFRSRYG